MKGRKERLTQFLTARLVVHFFRYRRWIGSSQEAVARADLQARTQGSDLDLVELRSPAHLVEIRPLGLISNQVIAAHVVESVSQPLTQVVVIVKEKPARPPRH